LERPTHGFQCRNCVKGSGKTPCDLEKLTQDLTVKSNQDDSSAALKKLIQDQAKLIQDQANRVSDLEKVVKTLVESRGDSKVDALSKLVTVMGTKITDFGNTDKMQKEINAKIEKMTMEGEKVRQQQEQELLNKVLGDVEKQKQQMLRESEKVYREMLEQRIKAGFAVIEARVAALESKK
jgi:hypothetical protein